MLGLLKLVQSPSNFLVYPWVYPWTDTKNKGLQDILCKPLFLLVRPDEFESPTPWFVDSWRHLRDGIRSFAIDAIHYAEILGEKAKEVSKPRLKEVLKSGYGIFSGQSVIWARLRFSPERARWVANEQWHPQQRGSLNLMEVVYWRFRTQMTESYWWTYYAMVQK